MSIPSIQEQTQSWDKWITEHVEQAPPNPASEYAAAWVIDKLKPRLKDQGTILEIGCADGWMANKLSALGSVTGFDLPTTALERAAKRYEHIKFVGGDILDHCLDGKKFDSIVCMQTLPHIADHKSFFAKTYSLLNPSGTLILTCQNAYVFKRMAWVNSGNEGQIRKWPTSVELVGLVRYQFKLKKFTSLYPGDGHMGMLRIFNSPKLTNLANRLFGVNFVRKVKEEFELGQFLAVVAERV